MCDNRTFTFARRNKFTRPTPVQATFFQQLRNLSTVMKNSMTTSFTVTQITTRNPVPKPKRTSVESKCNSHITHHRCHYGLRHLYIALTALRSRTFPCPHVSSVRTCTVVGNTSTRRSGSFPVSTRISSFSTPSSS